MSKPRRLYANGRYKRGWWIIRGPDNEIRLIRVETEPKQTGGTAA